MQLQRPVKVNEAIAFAESEFQKRTRFWPRLIVAHTEEKSQFGALNFALQVYEEIAKQREDNYVTNLVLELADILSSEDRMNADTLHEKSQAIWEDSEARAFLKRGVTRLINALCHHMQGRFDDYEVEATRALGMGILAEDERPIAADFSLVVNNFKQAYGQ